MTASRVVVVGSFAESLVNFRGSMLRAMVDRGHRVVACAPGPAKDVAEALRGWGVEFRELSLERAGMNPLRDLRALVQLTKLMRELRPHVFFGYTVKPVVYGGLAARFSGVPVICPMITGITHAFLRTDPKGRVAGAVGFWLYRLALAKAHRVFFQNPDDEAEFVRRRVLPDPGISVVVGGSGVDLDHYRVAPLPGGLSFLLIARLIDDKGIREYVAAAREIKRRHPAIVFRLVGWFDDKATAIRESEVREWAEAGTIEFLGRLDDVRFAIAASAVYVLPSYREGTPRTVLEAMAMGRAVITTDTPGCRETVRDGETGLLVPIKTVAPLVEAMERFIQEPGMAERMGRAGRQYAADKYDVRKVNEILLREMGLA